MILFRLLSRKLAHQRLLIAECPELTGSVGCAMYVADVL